MKYWTNLRREHARSSTVTLNMVCEFLESAGYEIVHEPTVNAVVGMIASAASTRALDKEPEGSAGALYLAVYDGKANDGSFTFDKRAASYLVVLRGKAQLPAKPSKEEQRFLARTIAIRMPATDANLATLESDVVNFIISIERFASALAQGVNSTNQYQALVDVAEEFFGNFISIVDPNNMLLAHTKHIEPIDDINKSLVRYRYHKESILNTDVSRGFLNEHVAGQQGILIFPPNNYIPATLVTSPIMVNGNYSGYVVMTCENDDVRPGTRDTFELFISYCEKVAALRNDMPAGRNPYAQNLLITLLTHKTVDPIFVEQQARRVAIPTSGAYRLLRIVWPEDCIAQMPFFIDEINRSDQKTRVAVHHENAALVLIYTDDIPGLNMIASRVLGSFPVSISYKIVASEVLATLDEVFNAYRSLKSVEKYENAIMRYKKQPEEDKPIMLTFRDAFAFYWSDPLRDASISNFAVSHMVVSDIARIDAEKRTDDLALLEAFLVNERKASTVAESHHLHRNGVLYRIKRIQERYGIDLNDHLTRQYILTCLRIRANVHGVALP